MRKDGRERDQVRPLSFDVGFSKWAEGSVLTRMGDTVVLCTATVEERVPPWLEGRGQGWVTAEYAMLPRATSTRTRRAVDRGRPDGRGIEIQRLIGRSLRAGVDCKLLGERTVTIDCDVLQADGGTRTASINGGQVALALAVERLMEKGRLCETPLVQGIAAVSMGIVDGGLLLDLDFDEDSRAEVDLNLVGTSAGRIVEVQGTGEKGTFTGRNLASMVDVGLAGIETIIAVQKAALGISD